MKAIFSSDNNPLYKDFLPYVEAAWERIGLEPFFIEVSEKSEFYVPDIPIGNQAQIIRVLLPALYPQENFITSDIDMLPMSIDYFSHASKLLKNNEIINLSADAYNQLELRHPICYWLASGETFSKITSVRDVKDVKDAMKDWYSKGYNWDTDEKIFSKLVIEKSNKNEVNFVGYQRGWQQGIATRRLDRSNWVINKKALESNFYIDSHMVRPLSENLLWLNPIFKTLGL